MNSSSQQHINLLLYCTLKLTNEVNDLKQENTELRVDFQQLKESSAITICELKEKLLEKENIVNRKDDDIEKQSHQKTDQISDDVKVTSDKIDHLEIELHEDWKKSKEDISSINNEIENHQEVTNSKFPATTRYLVCPLLYPFYGETIKIHLAYLN